ncbi:MAG: hypothetical protein WA708_02350 [Acidobacteriaceae bacterium]
MRIDPASTQEFAEPSESATASGATGRCWRVRLEVLTGLLALVPITLFFLASLGRLRYPFPLEQLEGPMLLAAERVAHGLPIYIRPNFTFIPYMYAPAYYYLSGWAVRWLGPSFATLRLISLLSTCGSFVLIYFFILKDTMGTRTRRHLAALAGAGLYASAYPWTRDWFDLGRVDAFYIFLLLLALLCTRRLHPVFAAVAWTLAFLAKQTIFPVALVMLCYDWKRPRRVLIGLGSFLLLTAISTRLLDHATHGWFYFYAFTVPHANRDLILRPAVTFIPSELIAPFGIALLIVAMAWARHRRSESAAEQSSTIQFYFLSAASTCTLCWFLQAHAGATSNTPMPAYAVLAVVFGIAFGWLDAFFAADSRREPARIFLLAAVCIPFLSWVYSPHDAIPHSEVAASQKDLVAWLREFPGDVFLPSNPEEAVSAGKLWHPDLAALHDSLRPDIPAIRQPLLAEIRAEIDQEKFDAIAFDGASAGSVASQPWLPADLQRHYPIVGLVPGSDIADPFTPHPVYFLLPCREQGLAMAKGWTLLQTGKQPPCQH